MTKGGQSPTNVTRTQYDVGLMGRKYETRLHYSNVGRQKGKGTRINGDSAESEEGK